MPLFFRAPGCVYRERPVLTDNAKNSDQSDSVILVWSNGSLMATHREKISRFLFEFYLFGVSPLI